jgi:hypothetical protein
MHSPFQRMLVLLALASTGCNPKTPPSGSGPLLPNYVDRGIVILDPNPQRPNYWDFDLVSYGERPEHTFRLKNLEQKTVTITSVQPSCGCVLATLSSPGQPLVRGLMAADAAPFRLAPGAVAELQVVIDTTVVGVMNADKLVTVRIASDSSETPFLGLEAHIKVTRDFLCSPALLDLGEIPQGGAKQANTSVVNESLHPQARILGLERVDGPFVAHVDEEPIGERITWRVTVEVREDAPFGLARGKVVLNASGTDGTGTGRQFEIPISGQVVPRILARPSALRLSITQDVAELSLECLLPDEKVAIKKVRFEGAGPDLKVDLEPTSPDKQGRASKWRVVLRVTPEGARGGYTRLAVIELDDAKIPELRVPVTVETR